MTALCFHTSVLLDLAGGLIAARELLARHARMNMPVVAGVNPQNNVHELLYRLTRDDVVDRLAELLRMALPLLGGGDRGRPPGLLTRLIEASRPYRAARDGAPNPANTASPRNRLIADHNQIGDEVADRFTGAQAALVRDIRMQADWVWQALSFPEVHLALGVNDTMGAVRALVQDATGQWIDVRRLADLAVEGHDEILTLQAPLPANVDPFADSAARIEDLYAGLVLAPPYRAASKPAVVSGLRRAHPG